MKHDVFVSHASEDKEAFVAPLADRLASLGLNVWYDAFTLKIGDSLSRSIDKGLAESRFGIVVLSKAFISKPWTEYELQGLVSKEIGRDKVILPLWHGLTRDDLLSFSPTLADKFALDTAKLDLHQIVLKIVEVVRPDIYNNLMRLKLLNDLRKKAKKELVSRKSLKMGPIRHEKLPDGLLIRIKLINHIFDSVMPMPLSHSINLFRRDVNPAEEIGHWERLAAAYLDITCNKNFSQEKCKDVAMVLMGISVGTLSDENAQEFDHLNYEEVVDIVESYRKVVPEIVAPENEEEE
jgi:hypothetical protein